MPNPTFEAQLTKILQDPTEMAYVHDPFVAAQLLKRVMIVENVPVVLACIRNSNYPESLFKLLPEHYGVPAMFSIAEQFLADFAKNAYWEKRGEEWLEDNVQEFADVFWMSVITYRIVRKDYRRAWELIKKAIAGFSIETLPDVKLTLERTRVLQLIDTLHAFLLEEGMEHHRAPVVIERIMLEQAEERKRSPKKYPGLHLVDQLGLYQREGMFHVTLTRAGMQLVEVARYMNEERREKRNKREAKRLYQAQQSQ